MSLFAHALISTLLVLCLIIAVTGVEDEFNEEYLKKLTVKQLRTFIAERGSDCTGCAEKEEFVKMAYSIRVCKTYELFSVHFYRIMLRK